MQNNADLDLVSRFQVIAESLMKRRTVVITELSTDSVGDIISRLLLLQTESSDPITILLDSGGGNSKAAFLICDLIEHLLTAPVRCIAVGSCGSAATFIMLHCAQRAATPYANFLIHSGKIHDVSLTMNSKAEEDVELLVREMRKSHEQVVQMYMEKLQKTREQVESYMARGDQDSDEIMSASEAKEIGLIQEIIEGKLNIFSSE